jgi:hypothetical protein
LYWHGAHGFSRRAGHASIARARQGGVMPARWPGTAHDAPSGRDWRDDPRLAMRTAFPEVVDLRRHSPAIYSFMTSLALPWDVGTMRRVS